MTTDYRIDPAHSSAQFSVRHMMITNVRGGFAKVEGTVSLDRDHPAQSRIQAVIDAGTISTNDPQRDAHLRSADFLETEKFPTIAFTGTNFEGSDGQWKVAGDLTIHGVTRPVVLQVEGPTPAERDPWGNTRIGASATTKIKRSDFGLTWNAALETGGILVGDDLKIELDVSLIAAPASPQLH